MSLLSAQALSIVSSLQEIKMDKLRGRVRAGSRFSRDSYIPARLADGMPSWVPGSEGQPLHCYQTGHPRPPKQPSLCCLCGPAQQFHFPGGRRETREKEHGGLRAQSGIRGSVCLSSVSSSTVLGVPPPSALLGPARGRATLISMALVLHSNTLV